MRSRLVRVATLCAVLVLAACEPPTRAVPLYVDIRGPVDATVLVPACPGDAFMSVGVSRSADAGVSYRGAVDPAGDGKAYVAKLVIDDNSLHRAHLIDGFETTVARPYPAGITSYKEVGGFDFTTHLFSTQVDLSSLDGLAPGMYRVDGMNSSASISPASFDERAYLAEVCGTKN